jgi:hypothetical protein
MESALALSVSPSDPNVPSVPNDDEALTPSSDVVLLSSKSRNGCRFRCPRNLPSRHFASSRIDDRRRPEARSLRRELYAARLVCALYRSSNAAAKYLLRWLRLSEQFIRVDKWSLCRGLGCQAEWQRGEIGLIGCLAVKARVRSAPIVQQGLRTPTGPFSENCFIIGIRGSGCEWRSMRRSTRLAAKRDRGPR